MEGKKEILGIYLSENEGARYWPSVLTDLQNRSLEDILIACIDGLKGSPGGHREYFSKDRNSAVYHSSDPKLDEVRGLEKPESVHGGLKASVSS
ncbi:MAG: putative transposase [Planctomycetota bacterium]|jgi:putative transposase